MSDYFTTPARLAALFAAAESWLGTPYVVSGAVRGSGASCHRLAGAILADAGFPLPAVPEKGATKLREFTATMRAWLDSQPSLSRIAETTDIRPGDILLCEYGVGHIGLAVAAGSAIQVLRYSPTHLVPLADPSVRERILAVYRPLDLHGQ